MLINLSGLPATGKTTIGRSAAAELGAVHLRIDTVEQAIVRAGLAAHPLGPGGYLVGYALVADLLDQGFTVVAESVNPLPVTRSAWREVAARADRPCLEAEVVCSDPAEHERRVASRASDVPGLDKPSWAQVRDREYAPWDRDHLVIDTAGRTVAESVGRLVAAAAALT